MPPWPASCLVLTMSVMRLAAPARDGQIRALEPRRDACRWLGDLFPGNGPEGAFWRVWALDSNGRSDRRKLLGGGGRDQRGLVVGIKGAPAARPHPLLCRGRGRV